MMNKRIILILYFLCPILCVCCTDVLVEVKQGQLRGEKSVTPFGFEYYSFKGIPYAQAPTGKLRFKAPQPPLSWDGVRNATQHGSVCPQIDIYNNNTLVPGDEDCLFLNVYSPNITSTNLTVMVFIHGGGYKSGSGNSDNYGPDFLVSANVLLVTMNYRLAALGFLCLENEEIPGNAALKDQRAALQWVQENIASFGGDPNKVTLFGQSAGSASVGYHILSPSSKGLFQRAIAMSGVPYCDFSIPFEPRRRAFKLGKSLGLETSNDTELLEFLQSVNTTQIVVESAYVLPSEEIVGSPLKMFSFVPVVEKNVTADNFLTQEPSAILNSGIFTPVDVMFGYTNEEALLLITELVNDYIKRYYNYSENFAPTKILFDLAPVPLLDLSDKIRTFYFGDKAVNSTNIGNFVSLINNSSFVYDVQRFFGRFPSFEGKRMYFYKFSTYSSLNVYGLLGAPYGLIGAAHLDDCRYLFNGTAFNVTLERDSTEYKLIQQVIGLFTDFAKYGNPTPETSTLGIQWPEYNNVTLDYLEMGNNLTVASAPDKEDVAFWKTILEESGLEF